MNEDPNFCRIGEISNEQTAKHKKLIDCTMAPGSSSKQRDYDYLFKLVLIGDSGVGKSCLLLRFAVRGGVRKRVRTRGSSGHHC